MQHYQPFGQPWYIKRSIENNPLRNGLESVVNDVSVNNSYAPHPSYAARIVKEILSAMPAPVGRIVLIGSLIGSLGLGIACDNRATSPSSTPPTTKQEQTIIQTPTITVETTYKVIFPYKEPSSSLEEKVYNNTDVATYMKFVRMKEDVKWAISLADLVNKSWSYSEWKDFFEKNKELGNLIPYIPIEDIGKYQQSQPNYQGTLNVDLSGKPIIAKPQYFQQTATGALIPLQEPDMVKQIFEELKAKFSAEEKTSGQSKIAFVSERDGNHEIYVMNADGSEQKRLTNNPAIDTEPSWSPDGKKIAFVSGRDGNPEIYLMNVDGSRLERLTNNPAIDVEPSWSPDGKKIAFRSNRDGNYEIYLMNVDGSGLERLTNNPADDGLPSWSPDWKKIAFVSDRDKNGEIYVMNVDGSGQKRLTNNPADDGLPSWSPDGKKIAFVSKRDGNYEVYVMNVDGSEQKNLTKNSADDVYPSWSPDGKKIAFNLWRDGNSEIYVMNADGSGQKRLTNNPARDDLPAWSPFLSK